MWYLGKMNTHDVRANEQELIREFSESNSYVQDKGMGARSRDKHWLKQILHYCYRHGNEHKKDINKHNSRALRNVSRSRFFPKPAASPDLEGYSGCHSTSFHNRNQATQKKEKNYVK